MVDLVVLCAFGRRHVAHVTHVADVAHTKSTYADDSKCADNDVAYRDVTETETSP